MNDADFDDLYESLTQRELEILNLLAQGFSNREIADDLFIEVTTVKWFNTQIYGKLGVKKRQQAILRARQLGLLEQQGDSPTRPAIFPKTNLPAQTTRFIGRENELAELQQLIKDDSIRLITILATGGMGKSRLAIEVARSQMNAFPDGVYFVALNTINDSEAIPTAMSSALGMQFQQDGREEIKQITDYLRDKQVLLILDNFEHLLDGVGLVDTLLKSAPQLKLIVTSRERLNISSEHVLTLDGLDFEEVTRVEEAMQCDALQFLVQNAKHGLPQFELSANNLKSAVRICHLTQGMPLGIMLATAWVSVLSLEEIADEIERNIDILAHEQRDLPERQHSIRAIFDYTWKRLLPEDRNGIMYLSIFRGGCTRDAIQSITGIQLPVLMHLIDKALMWRDPENGRYQLHGLLRQYAYENLLEATMIDELSSRHSTYYLTLLHTAETDLKGAYQIPALDELEDDVDNIRTAWQDAISRRKYDLVNDAIEGLRLFCTMRGLLRERNELFQMAWNELGQGQNLETHPVLSRLLVRYRRAEAEQCLELARHRRDEPEIAFCLYSLGYIELGRRHFQQAIDYLEASIGIYRSVNDLFYVGRILSNLGFCYLNIGQQKRAIETQQESLKIMEAIGDVMGYAGSIYARGASEYMTGNYLEAERLYRESFTYHHEIGNPSHIGWVSAGLSYLAFLRGDLESAEILAEETIEISSNSAVPVTDLNYRGGEAIAFSVLGHIANMRKDYKIATAMYENARPFSRLASNFDMVSSIEWGRAITACGENDFATAKSYLRQMLERALHLDSPGFMTLCLPVVAVIITNMDNHMDNHVEAKARAVQVLALADSHPATATGWMREWELLATTRASLKGDLNETDYEEALQVGKSLNLKDAVLSLLETW